MYPMYYNQFYMYWSSHVHMFIFIDHKEFFINALYNFVDEIKGESVFYMS